MRSPGCDLTKLLLPAAACLASYVAGCGNSCFVGYSVNGNGGVIVKGGNPPPVCTLNQAQGNVRVAMAKSATCQSCAPVAGVQHMFIKLRGVQIHSYGEDGDAAWLDLAPELAAQPLGLDLIGDGLSDVGVSSSMVPAGTYDTLRLQFAPGSATSDAEAQANPERCGGKVSNCLILGDGRTEELTFAGQPAELVLPIAGDGQPLLVLPDTSTELQIHLGARQVTDASDAHSATRSMRVVGEVVIRRGTD